MVSNKEIQERFKDINDSVRNDDEIMLKILLKMFGDVQGLWDAIHEDITHLNEYGSWKNQDLDDIREECLESLESSYDSIMNEITERELLDHEI